MARVASACARRCAHKGSAIALFRQPILVTPLCRTGREALREPPRRSPRRLQPIASPLQGLAASLSRMDERGHTKDQAEAAQNILVQRRPRPMHIKDHECCTDTPATVQHGARSSRAPGDSSSGTPSRPSLACLSTCAVAARFQRDSASPKRARYPASRPVRT